MKTRLSQIVRCFHGKRILVLGDVILDEYLWGKVTRISPEAPIPVVDVQSISFAPGGAANVAANITALGGETVLLGVIGDDEPGKRLTESLKQQGISTRFLVDSARPTSLKTRIVAHSQQMVRVDRESRALLSSKSAKSLLAIVQQEVEKVDAVLVSDYGKGVTVPSLMRGLISLAQEKGKIILVDPKGADYSKYRGATMITPNEAEAGRAIGTEITSDAILTKVGRGLLQRLNCQAVLITRGERGLSLFEASGSITHLPTFARQVYDVTGAGDTVVSTVALALSAGADFVEACNIANHAAGVVVSRVGTVAVTLEELTPEISGI